MSIHIYAISYIHTKYMCADIWQMALYKKGTE